MSQNSWPILSIFKNGFQPVLFFQTISRVWGAGGSGGLEGGGLDTKQLTIHSPSWDWKHGHSQNLWSKNEPESSLSPGETSVVIKPAYSILQLHLGSVYVICIGISGMWGCELLATPYIIIKGLFFFAESKIVTELKFRLRGIFHQVFFKFQTSGNQLIMELTLVKSDKAEVSD